MKLARNTTVSEKDVFFAPIPRTYTSLTLDGTARNFLFFIYMDTQDRTILSCLDPFFSYLLIPEKRNHLV